MNGYTDSYEDALIRRAQAERTDALVAKTARCHTRCGDCAICDAERLTSPRAPRKDAAATLWSLAKSMEGTWFVRGRDVFKAPRNGGVVRMNGCLTDAEQCTVATHLKALCSEVYDRRKQVEELRAYARKAVEERDELSRSLGVTDAIDRERARIVAEYEAVLQTMKREHAASQAWVKENREALERMATVERENEKLRAMVSDEAYNKFSEKYDAELGRLQAAHGVEMSVGEARGMLRGMKLS